MKSACFHVDLFDDGVKQKKKPVVYFSEVVVSKFRKYNLQDYVNDIETDGLEIVWAYICAYVLQYGENADFLNVRNFGEMYEIGLAIQDKRKKKNNGQYYTPEDVASVMVEWLDSLEGENVCDVACGTGKLILTYLDYIGIEKARNLILKKNLYLYDDDSTALDICKTSILLKYGLELGEYINVVDGDFLSKNVVLPSNSKVISNPPYAAIQQKKSDWKDSDVLNDSRELYSVFMEKIVKESKSSVIITPYSFISGTKFLSLRRVLNECSGKIFSFDNVPGNIFCGRKHGIFNTNTSNSVRAAITVVEKKDSAGFRLTPLIRFKSIERERLLKCAMLESFLSMKRQKISQEQPMYYKCFRELQPLYEGLTKKSEGHKLKELISKDGEYTLSMPNTCRYYTTAFSGIMKRNGQLVLHFDDEKKFNYAYCLINSSFVYWHWRLFDGGITYPASLLMNVPILFNTLNEKDHSFFKNMYKEMSSNAHKFVVKKMNVGVQENIKYPREYRDAINRHLLNILGIKMSEHELDKIHSNMALEVNL